jgi:outer membrane protein assembly factor BamB
VVVHGDLLLINALGSGLALNKTTGALVWKSRPGIGGYATPVVATLAGRTQALFFGSRSLSGADPLTGELLWSVDWVTRSDVNAADPLVFGNRVFVSSNYGRGGAVFEISSAGARKIWENREVSSHFSSFVFRDGYIYANSADANSHRGDFVCLEADTGRVMWRERAGVGSLIAAGDRLILLTEDRRLVVAELTPEAFRPLARAVVGSRGLMWTAPVLSRGRLYVRSMQGELSSIDLSVR